jgi:hypothetical protein
VGSLAAYVVLGDRLKTPVQYLGLAMTGMGVYLLRRDVI